MVLAVTALRNAVLSLTGSTALPTNVGLEMAVRANILFGILRVMLDLVGFPVKKNIPEV